MHYKNYCIFNVFMIDSVLFTMSAPILIFLKKILYSPG